MFEPPSKFYTVSTVLFHKDVGANVAFTNFMTHFSLFLPTNANVKLANGYTGNAYGIGIILCHFPNCSIIYLVRPVYYFPGHPSSTISPFYLKFYAGFQKVTSEPLENFDFFGPQDHPWISLYQTQNNLDHLQIKIFKVNPHRDTNFLPTVCALSKQNISHLIHHHFGRVYITRLKQMAKKASLKVSQRISLTWKNHNLFFS